jgi:hypothetical protein
LIHRDGSGTVCTRVKSDHPRPKLSGWFHAGHTDSSSCARIVARGVLVVDESLPQIGYAAARNGDLPANPLVLDPVTSFHENSWQANAGNLSALADAWGLPRTAIYGAWGDSIRCGKNIGFPGDDESGGWKYGFGWALPETKGGKIVGYNARAISGAKRNIGPRGLALPVHWRDRDQAGPVLIVEGHSDTTVLDAAGRCAIGRPCNTGGALELAAVLADMPTDRPIIVVGENDEKPDGLWPGSTGAQTVARVLKWELPNHDIRFAMPPAEYKDVRAGWLIRKAAGAMLQQYGDELVEHLLATSFIESGRRGKVELSARQSEESRRDCDVGKMLAIAHLVEFDDTLPRAPWCGYIVPLKKKTHASRRATLPVCCHSRQSCTCPFCANRERYLDGEHFATILYDLPRSFGAVVRVDPEQNVDQVKEAVAAIRAQRQWTDRFVRQREELRAKIVDAIRLVNPDFEPGGDPDGQLDLSNSISDLLAQLKPLDFRTWQELRNESRSRPADYYKRGTGDFVRIDLGDGWHCIIADHAFPGAREFDAGYTAAQDVIRAIAMAPDPAPDATKKKRSVWKLPKLKDGETVYSSRDTAGQKVTKDTPNAVQCEAPPYARPTVIASHYWLRQLERTDEWDLDREALPLVKMRVAQGDHKEALAAAGMTYREAHGNWSNEPGVFFDATDEEMRNYVAWWSFARDMDCRPQDFPAFVGCKLKYGPCHKPHSGDGFFLDFGFKSEGSSKSPRELAVPIGASP